MGAFEYLSVLISIILALGMTRVLAGVGEMLQAHSPQRLRSKGEQRQPRIETKVGAKSLWENGKPVRSTHEFQKKKEGTPRIDVGRRGYLLYGVEGE